MRVDTQELRQTAADLQRLGAVLDGSIGGVQTGLHRAADAVSDEAGEALISAWQAVRDAVHDLAAGYSSYGRAFGELAARYDALDGGLLERSDRR